KVGQGGMGIVYSARQTNVNRLVALKAIKSELQANDDNRRKFFYEAQITADLDHPNIAPIYELGASEDGLLFYSMKLITGTEWKDSIKTNSREQNLEIFAKVTDAMAFAHSKGIVHRDLKPANTMIGPYGEVYVTDWGIAIDTRKKAPFGLAGSPAYMAPEMAWHQVAKIGPASDIYILGAILYQIITGLPPHPGRNVKETVSAAAKNQIIPFTSDDALLPIAMKAMETDIEDRYQSVEEMQDALREYRQHAESIALAHRSEELLGQAKVKKDYDLFSRAVFGYRDAVELWPENEAAIAGQRNAQLEYGKCAVAKGDYDLAMQTLDSQDAAQAVIYQQAVKGKQLVEGREKRVKNLRRIVVAVVLMGIGLSSTMAIFAWIQKGRAEVNEATAVAATKSLGEANKKLNNSLEEIQIANVTIRNEKDAADKARNDADIAKNDAVKAKDDAVKARDDEERQRKIAVSLAEQEKKARDDAVKSENIAKLARIAAERAAAQIKLEEFKSALPLAKSQLESFDVKAARKNLADSNSDELDADIFGTRKPKTDIWPLQRVKLLSNIDLPQTQLGSGATSLDYAPAVNLGAVGTKSGQVHLLSFANGELKQLATHTEKDALIDAVAISPAGDEIVYSFKRGEVHGFRVWSVSASGAKAEPVEVKKRGAYSLQGFSYSQDGTYIVAGINQGVWLWNRTGNWFENEADKQYKKIRGRLKSISMIDASHAIIAAQISGESEEGLTLYTIDLNAQNSSRRIVLPPELDKQVTAISYDQADKRAVVGTSLGHLFTATLEPVQAKAADDADEKLGGSQLANAKEILPLKHRTAVEQIITDAKGQMLTTSAEPVAHVWKREPTLGWMYDTYLTGTEANLAAAAFAGPGTVLGIDAGGLSMIWDVERQKRRRQLIRVEADGIQPAMYPSPIVGVFTHQDGSALAVNTDGMIERWDIRTGKTIPFDSGRWIYTGHTPGADFVDSAVSSQAGILATAARLTNVDPAYMGQDDGQWEFCVWDLNSGAMKRRWRSRKADEMPDASSQQRGMIEQRLSLVDDGRALILASDSQTRVMSLEGQEIFVANDFGTYFAIPHPQQTNLVMLVMRSGSMRILYLKRPDSWAQAPRDYSLAAISASDSPQQGTWSPDGRHFYWTFTSGAVAAVAWNGQQLDIQWSSYSLDSQPETSELTSALVEKAARVKSHADIDMSVEPAGDKERLHIARRVGGARGITDLTVLEFSKAANPKVSRSNKDGIWWLDDSQGSPKLIERLHGKLVVDNQQVAARRRIQEQVYITTRAANVFRMSVGSTNFTSYGREKLVNVTGNRAGDLLVALFADGSLKRFELTDAVNAWKQCGFAAPGCTQAALSPDGTQLALLGQANQVAFMRVVDASTGAELMRMDGAVAVTWDPQADHAGAVCFQDGKIETFNGQVRQAIETQALVENAQVVSLHYLLETWSNSQEPSIQHLVVHTETVDSGHLEFIPLKKVEGRVVTLADLEKLDKGTRLSVSPTEAVLVTGDKAGTVKLWFASPTWDDKKPKELYELEGHRGANIELATFSHDGTTLISADSKNRVYGWLSRD
ncbi:MAG: protein kinase, partial [Pirellulaceae bacterium]|nr:protein kinase [Pirellulaceae bacterium]